MKELSLKVLSEKGNSVHYRGFYRFTQFEMIVDLKQDGTDEYKLVSGDLTKNEWADVIAKYYHDDFSIR